MKIWFHILYVCKYICMYVYMNIPLPTLPYMYSPFGAGGAVGQRPTSESNFFSRLRYETHFPTPASSFPLGQTELN